MPETYQFDHRTPPETNSEFEKIAFAPTLANRPPFRLAFFNPSIDRSANRGNPGSDSRV